MIAEIAVAVGVPHQELQVPIEGRVYSFELRWAGREERWYLDLRDDEGAAIYTGIAVVLNFPLGIRCANERMWPGVLLATDTSGENAEPGLEDFGDRVKLIYYSADELPLTVEVD